MSYSIRSGLIRSARRLGRSSICGERGLHPSRAEHSILLVGLLLPATLDQAHSQACSCGQCGSTTDSNADDGPGAQGAGAAAGAVGAAAVPVEPLLLVLLVPLLPSSVVAVVAGTEVAGAAAAGTGEAAGTDRAV